MAADEARAAADAPNVAEISAEAATEMDAAASAAAAGKAATEAARFSRRGREDRRGTDRSDRRQCECSVANVKHGSLQKFVRASSHLPASICSRHVKVVWFKNSSHAQK
jgi:hypothetical protein